MTIHSQHPSHVNAARKKRKGPPSSHQSTVPLPQFDVNTNTTSSRWNYANPRYTRNTFNRRSYHNHNNSSVETVPKSPAGIDKSHHQHHHHHHHATKPAKVYPPSTKCKNSKTLRKPSPASSQSQSSPNSTPSPNKYRTSSPPSKASGHQAPYAHSHEQAVAGAYVQNGNHAQVPFSQRINTGGRTNGQRRTGRNSKAYHRNAPPSNAYTSAQFYGFQNKLRAQQRQARQVPRVETQTTTSNQPGPSATGFVLVRTVDECRAAVEALSHHSHIALDCEGVALSRTGRLCLLQAASPDTAYIFDLIDNSATTLIGENSPNNSNSDLNPAAELRLKMEQNRAQLSHARQLFEKGGLRELLENDKIIKVMHDCRHDSDALYHQFGIRLGPVIDTQVVFFILRRTMGMEDGLPVSLKTLLRKFSFVSEDELHVKHTVKDRMKGDNEFWLQRPLSDVSLWYARLDVHHLLALTNVLAELIQSSSDQAWADVQRESQLYLSVFRDDFDGPRKAQVEYEMRAKIARRERTAAKVSKKASLHRKNDPLVSFKLDRPRVISALNI